MKWPPKEKRGCNTALKENDTRQYHGAKGLQHPLCWWRMLPGICRFQTSSPQLARKLSQRSGARLVAWSVSGGYLRIFQEQIEPWRARNLVERYLAPTNGAFFPDAPPQDTSEARERVKTAGEFAGGRS